MGDGPMESVGADTAYKIGRIATTPQSHRFLNGWSDSGLEEGVRTLICNDDSGRTLVVTPNRQLEMRCNGETHLSMETDGGIASSVQLKYKLERIMGDARLALEHTLQWGAGGYLCGVELYGAPKSTRDGGRGFLATIESLVDANHIALTQVQYQYLGLGVFVDQNGDTAATHSLEVNPFQTLEGVRVNSNGHLLVDVPLHARSTDLLEYFEKLARGIPLS